MARASSRPDRQLSVVALAVGTSSVAVGADVAARVVEIGSPWILVSVHVWLLTALVAVGDLVSWGRSDGARRLAARWRVAAGLVATVAVVGLQVQRSLTDPLPKPFLALLVLPALAFADQLRVDGGASVGSIAGQARRWCHLGALGALWARFGATERGAVRVAGIEAGLSGTALLLGAVVALLASGGRGRVHRIGGALHLLAGGLLLAGWVDGGAGSEPGGVAVGLAVAGSLVLLAGTSPSAVRAQAPVRRVAASTTGRLVRVLPWARTRPAAWWQRAARASAPASVTAAPRRSVRLAVVAGAMALGSVAFVASGIAWAASVGWQPTGHAASIMARAYDVGTANHPLVGMVTSLGEAGGANHPGPMLLDLLAPLVRLLGMRRAAYVGGAAVALLCWAVATWAAWRAAGRVAAVLAWVTSALVIEIAALGAVWDANTVSTTMLAMFATVMAAWAASTGTWRAWWWAVALGSLSAQAYLPHGLIVIGPVLWSGLALAGARRRASGAEARRITQAIRGGWAIALVCWAQPMLDVLVDRGGNVRALATQLAQPRPPVGIGGVPRALAWIFSVPPRWSSLTTTFARGGSALSFLSGPLAAGLLIGLAVLVAAWRTRRHLDVPSRQLRTIVALVLLGAVVNVTQLPQDRLRSFALGWLVVASMVLWFAVVREVAVALTGAMRDRAPGAERIVHVAAGVAAALVVLVAAVAGPDEIEDMKGRSFAIDAMVDPVVDQTVASAPDEQVLVLGLDTLLTQVATDTVVSNLIVRGLDVQLEPGPGLHYGERRLATGDWDGPMLWVVSGLSPVKPPGVRIARAEMPGWTSEPFERVTARLEAWIEANGPLTLQPWVLSVLPRYLTGWVPGDVCELAAEVASGEKGVEDLPTGAMVALLADLAIASPVPPSLSEEAAGVVGPSPIEVWLVEGSLQEPITSDRLQRDGSQCPPPPIPAP